MKKTRATRHNGRTGAGGVFRAGHNDRTFDLDNAGHIDQTRCSINVYWDCYQGLNFPDKNGIRPERKFTFDEIELIYYTDQFGDSIEAQNERHRQSRHKERIRSVEDILKDSKTCPEESVYQLGTKDGHEDPALFVQVFLELKDEIEKHYGSNIKVLDWALHMDEATPHIHERHVFFADDGYGTNFPKQDMACEALGFERPDPEKKSGKNNNRKMSFDAEIRRIYIEIAEKHGITIEKVPLEGKEHLEKNDFIIAMQEEARAVIEVAKAIHGDSPYLFHEKNCSKMIPTDGYAQNLRKRCRRLGCVPSNNHAFRMAFNSRLIELGFSASDRALILGHEVQTNETHYSLTDKRRLDVIKDRLICKEEP